MMMSTAGKHLPFAAMLAFATAPLGAETVGGDAAYCETGRGPAIQANVLGLKDRAGEIWFELYPATEADFLRPDMDLVAEGKTFRRTRARLPASGPVSICIRVPHAGRYSVMVRHNRIGKDKFSIWSDGVGFPDNRKMGRNRPKFSQALIDAGPGVTAATIRLQYLRGFGGFGPLDQ